MTRSTQIGSTAVRNISLMLLCFVERCCPETNTIGGSLFLPCGQFGWSTHAQPWFQETASQHSTTTCFQRIPCLVKELRAAITYQVQYVRSRTYTSNWDMNHMWVILFSGKGTTKHPGGIMCSFINENQPYTIISMRAPQPCDNNVYTRSACSRKGEPQKHTEIWFHIIRHNATLTLFDTSNSEIVGILKAYETIRQQSTVCHTKSIVNVKESTSYYYGVVMDSRKIAMGLPILPNPCLLSKH